MTWWWQGRCHYPPQLDMFDREDQQSTYFHVEQIYLSLELICCRKTVLDCSSDELKQVELDTGVVSSHPSLVCANFGSS